MPNLNSGSGRARRRDAAASIEHLMDAASATFAEHGYHSANVHEICARAKVGIGTFYAHFDHKSQLLRRVMEERVILLSDLLTEQDLTDIDRLTKKLRQTIDEPVAAGLWRAWHEAVHEDDALRGVDEEWRRRTWDALTVKIASVRAVAGVRDEPPSEAVAWVLMSLTREPAIVDRSLGPGIETLARIAMDMILGGAVASAPLVAKPRRRRA